MRWVVTSSDISSGCDTKQKFIDAPLLICGRFIPKQSIRSSLVFLDSTEDRKTEGMMDFEKVYGFKCYHKICGDIAIKHTCKIFLNILRIIPFPSDLA